MMQANTGVRFETKDLLLSQLVKQAEEKCRLNIKNFGGDPVLVEGGGYEKIWLETQPMGGAMYASRDFATGLNNSLMFMRHQRADGRIPGSIAVIDGKVVPQFNKFQGFCFPEPALDLYYLGGKDAEYLAQLAKTLEAFDAYLWRVRDSDGDGCLETWCKYDTGEDHAMRYADAPDPWEEETPPQGCTAVPIASMDVMSYSYACRETLAEIARISGDAEAQAQWAAKAKAVQDKMVSYLWDDARGAMFDRDKNHNQMPTLIHNTLRCMYWHSLPDALAERFVKEHLLNPQEFWTQMPLPSVAANDPLFRNVTTNNWSGQAEALTYQRAIRALENYGMYELIPQLGQKLMQAIGPQCRFVQQYDPFTGEPSVICEPGQPPQDAYGPAMLSVLEYTARMYGVSLVRDTVVWGTCPLECRYTQALNGRSWEIVNSGHEAEAFVDGRKVFTAGPGLRITTDLDGNILGTARYLPDADPAQVTPQYTLYNKEANTMEYLYPGGLAKAITFSYDDGQVYDRRLIEIFNQAGFKGTFHLNSGNLDKDGYVQKAELPTLYAEHEIACHGVTHRHPRQMNQTEWLREVWQDRLTLEELTGGIVQGMSYAFGEYYPEQVEALCAMGIQYSRTVESTGSFALPQELLRWKPTCHHNDKLLERAEKFLHVPGYQKMPLFYIWGHSFEFERENTWPLMEQLAEKLHGAQDIWYATNGQIADYLTALHSTRESADGKRLYNPSAQPIWFVADGKVRVAEPGKLCEM